MAAEITHLGVTFTVTTRLRKFRGKPSMIASLCHEGREVSSSTRFKTEEEAIEAWTTLLENIFYDRDIMLARIEKTKRERNEYGVVPGRESGYRTTDGGWKRRRA